MLQQFFQWLAKLKQEYRLNKQLIRAKHNYEHDFPETWLVKKTCDNCPNTAEYLLDERTNAYCWVNFKLCLCKACFLSMSKTLKERYESQ